MADLGTNVRYIKGIGEARAAALEKLGLTPAPEQVVWLHRPHGEDEE